MQLFKWAASAATGLALSLVLHAAAVSAAMPANEYACQVRTVGGRIGLVLVQADTRALAEKAAVGARAMTSDDIPDRAKSVVECILRPGERFRDYQFQAYFESVPL